MIRPETYINQYIDPNWKPFLQTPPFLNISADILLSLLHLRNLFQEFMEIRFHSLILPKETGVMQTGKFESMSDCSMEVSMSRFYGGIHYYKAVIEGRNQGNKIGDLIVDKLMATKKEIAKTN
jgi:hypothetical protein